jgi:hypothetical protein
LTAFYTRKGLLESSIENYLCKQVEANGGRCEKIVDKSRRGAPDREIQWPGPLPCAGIDKVELKKYGEPPDDHQVRYHQYLARCGVPVYVLDCKRSVDDYIAARLLGRHDSGYFSVPVVWTR